MGRLTGKNVLMVIPKDYYNEEELDIPLKIFKEEDAKVLIASAKLKDAVGLNGGSMTPDLLLVDAMEGITGDSYVTAGKGTRQIKGIFHGTVVVGGRGAKSYLWKDEMLRLLLNDRYRSGFVVGAIGMAVPALAAAGLTESQEVASDDSKACLEVLEKNKTLLAEEEVFVLERIITAKGASVAEPFARAMVEAMEKTSVK